MQINDRYEFPLQLDLDRENGKYLSPEADRSVRNLYTLHRYQLSHCIWLHLSFSGSYDKIEPLPCLIYLWYVFVQFGLRYQSLFFLSFFPFLQCFGSQWWCAWWTLLCLYQTNSLRSVVCNLLIEAGFSNLYISLLLYYFFLNLSAWFYWLKCLWRKWVSW
jgi:hypothetical protein